MASVAMYNIFKTNFLIFTSYKYTRKQRKIIIKKLIFITNNLLRYQYHIILLINLIISVGSSYLILIINL